jgi:hypothetical protein
MLTVPTQIAVKKFIDGRSTNAVETRPALRLPDA